jgi:hypothetical protein
MLQLRKQKQKPIKVDIATESATSMLKAAQLQSEGHAIRSS